MPIVSKLKVVMADRDISVNELSEKVGRSAVNLSHLRCNHSKGIRISLLEDLCRELHCQPGEPAGVAEASFVIFPLKRHGKDA